MCCDVDSRSLLQVPSEIWWSWALFWGHYWQVWQSPLFVVIVVSFISFSMEIKTYSSGTISVCDFLITDPWDFCNVHNTHRKWLNNNFQGCPSSPQVTRYSTWPLYSCCSNHGVGFALYPDGKPWRGGTTLGSCQVSFSSMHVLYATCGWLLS